MSRIARPCSIFFQQARSINYVTPPFLSGQSVLAAKQFDRQNVEYVLKAAKRMQEIVETKGYDTELQGKVLLNVFMEPSTRTSSSFQTAMLRLGGTVVPVNESSSSVKKGETLEDTMKVIENYADVIVLRHPEVGAADRAAAAVSVPVINAGDGPGEHPTQALLDCTCINGELGGLDGKTVTFVGDIKFGRTVHSLSQVLKHFDVKINFVSSDNLRATEGFLNKLNAAGVKYNQFNLRQLDEVLPTTDVLYCTRVQQERFASKEEYEKEKGLYIISSELLDKHRSKQGMIVLHPLPRVDEIVPAFDKDIRARYFKQVRYGVYARMALLSEVLRKN